MCAERISKHSFPLEPDPQRKLQSSGTCSTALNGFCEDGGGAFYACKSCTIAYGG